MKKESRAIRYAAAIARTRARAIGGFCSKQTARKHIAAMVGTCVALGISSEVARILARR
jgi:hypothetical protein